MQWQHFQRSGNTSNVNFNNMASQELTPIEKKNNNVFGASPLKDDSRPANCANNYNAASLRQIFPKECGKKRENMCHDPMQTMASEAPPSSEAKRDNSPLPRRENSLSDSNKDSGDSGKRRRVNHDYRKLSNMGYYTSGVSGSKSQPVSPNDIKGIYAPLSTSNTYIIHLDHSQNPKTSFNWLILYLWYYLCYLDLISKWMVNHILHIYE